MSVVTAMSLVLFVGFVATGLVAFLGWRKRMREGAGFSAVQLQMRSRSTREHAGESMKQYDLEGAPL